MHVAIDMYVPNSEAQMSEVFWVLLQRNWDTAIPSTFRYSKYPVIGILGCFRSLPSQYFGLTGEKKNNKVA